MKTQNAGHRALLYFSAEYMIIEVPCRFHARIKTLEDLLWQAIAQQILKRQGNF